MLVITKDEVMQIAVKNKDIFPVEVRELLHAFYSADFFEESMLIGSWVMPLYHFGRLKTVVDSLKISKKTQKALRTSCEAIDFPPQRLGLQ